MTTYLMIHGGAHGSWCWAPLLSWLEAPMLAVDLPGRGRRPAALEDQTYRSFVSSVKNQVIDGNLRDLVIVAHSMGGLTAIGLMHCIAERIRHVVFVASPIPAPGESIPQLLRRGNTSIAVRQDSRSAIESGVCNSGLRELLFHDLNEGDAQFCMARVTAESMAVYNEPVDLTGLTIPIPRTYVRTQYDRGLPPELQDESIARIPKVRVRELATGHTAMFADSRGLANIIMDCSSHQVAAHASL